MRQEAKSIYEFKKGDVITRIEPVIMPEGEKEYSFVGKKFIFMGIANASIYLSKELDALSTLFIGKDKFTVQLPLDIASEGWSFYIDPEFLEEGNKSTSTSTSTSEDEKDIKQEIKDAIEREDFEEAEYFKKKLQKLKDKNK